MTPSLQNNDMPHTVFDRVKWILRRVPAACVNQTLLTLLYWKLFDNIDISDSLLHELSEHATSPETISRNRRFVLQSRKFLLDIITSVFGE